MANIQQQRKRNRQNEKLREQNTRVRSSVRTASKKVLKSVEAADTDPANTAKVFNDFVKTIDTAARKGIVKKQTAARKKSRLAKRINALAGKQAQEQVQQ